jgi:hypothetical protein
VRRSCWRKRGFALPPDRQAQLATDLQREEAAPPADPACIASPGDRQYQIGPQALTVVSEREDTVLQAFLDQTAMDHPTLIERTEYEDAARILRGLAEKYGGAFAPAIFLPGGKGRGGYRVTIRRA